jgi:sigma-E factor negative regulatory protein RseB
VSGPSRQPFLQRAAALLTLSIFAVSAMAMAGGDGDVDAAALFARMRVAAQELNYQGTMVMGSGATVISSSVTHYVEGAQHYERVESLAGEMKRQYRHNDRMMTFWPARHVLVIEQNTPGPDAMMTALPDLPGADAYRIRGLGNDRLAGQEAQVLMLVPVDDLRYAQKLWVEKSTGLLLRADTLGPGGEVLEYSAFSDIEIGVKPNPELILQPMKQVRGNRIVQPAAAVAHPEDLGWKMPTVPGFRPIGCVRRLLAPVPANGSRTAHEVLHSVFSDGMTHVSVFIERFDAQHHRPLKSTVGAAHTWAERRGDSWITVIGDVPMVTVERFAAALERGH